MNIVLVGIQGSGKGTQAKRMVEEFGFVLFDTGRELRKFAETDHPRAEEAKKNLLLGLPVSMDTVRETLLAFLEQHKDAKHFVFDGIPRMSMAERKMFEEIFPQYSIIFLDLDRDTAMKRLSWRRVCPITGEGFPADFPHDFNPKNGEKLVTRHDDTPEAIERRIEIFFMNTLPLVISWRADGYDIHTINATESSDEIFVKIAKIIKKKLPKKR